MNVKKFLKALEEKDNESAKEEMMLFFEEKLERKIWKIYNSLESDLKLSKNEEDNK